MSDDKWTKEQLAAIEARNCNLLVAAAAGAGKTAVLVERIIRMITDKNHPLDIDTLLVVTFTNAAAAEMRSRIGNAISRVLEENPSSNMLQRQLTLLNKASITTIHSFCLEVIRSNFQKIDIDPAFRIADETEATLLKLEVLQELFEDLYEDTEANQTFLELLECYGGNRDDQALQTIVLNLYDYIQSDPWPMRWLEKSTQAFDFPEGKDLSETVWGQVLLETAALELQGISDLMAKAIAIIELEPGLEKYLPLYYDESVRIDELLEVCKSESPLRWDKVFNGLQNLSFDRLPSAPRDIDQELKKYVRDIRDYSKSRVNDLRQKIFIADSAETRQDLQLLYPLLEGLSRLVKKFASKYAVKKRDKSLVDFNDLEHFCLDILSEEDKDGEIRPSLTALEYRNRFAEILVDEYQDSNDVQETIIRMISKTDQDEPNVFMVGDVKQSIYRFRQAKPELFQEKYDLYSECRDDLFRKILLNRNFRSRKEIIDGVNYIFRQIMSKTVGELDYTDKEVLNPGASYEEAESDRTVTGGEVELHLLHTNNDKLTQYEMEGEEETEEAEELNEEDSALLEEPEMLDRIQCEARLAARRIKQLMLPDEEGRTFKVFDKEQERYRNIEYRDIVILLRTTKGWSDVFTEEFSSESIPAFADTGTGFFKTVEVQVILSLLQVIDNPLQDIPLLAVLRSPIMSFSADELAVLRLADRKCSIFEALQVLIRENRENAVKGQEEKDNNSAEKRTANEKANGKANEKANEEMELKETVEVTAVRKASSFLEKLERWRKMSVYMSADELLWQLYEETGYYGAVGAMSAGQQRQANLRVLFDRARQFEETSFKGLFNFIYYVDKLQSSQGDMGSAKILGENDNVVRIMSIHKSKGLEFPVVILAGCGKKINLMDMNKSILLHHNLGFGPDVVDYRKRFVYPSIPKIAIREKIRIETMSEEMRILYVALTRAKEKLIISGTVKDLPKAMQKWVKSADTEELSLAPYQMLKAERYLDWIAPAILRHKGSAGLVKSMGLNCFCPGDNESRWKVQMWDKKDLLNVPAAGEQEEEEIFNLFDNLADYSLPVPEDIRRRLSWEYPFRKLTGVPAKVTVTELKSRYERDLAEGIESLPQHIPSLIKKPMFLEKTKGLSASEKGSVMHFVMQHLNFANSDIDNQIEEMLAKDLLTEEQAANIDRKKIKTFLSSQLGKRMIASPDINREVRFNLEIPCREVYQETDEDGCGGETILLQGVIDCYFQEPDGIVLLDYKSDYVTEGGQRTIQERYRLQISYYARALEELTGKKIKQKFIYLFHTGEALEYK